MNGVMCKIEISDQNFIKTQNKNFIFLFIANDASSAPGRYSTYRSWQKEENVQHKRDWDEGLFVHSWRFWRTDVCENEWKVCGSRLFINPFCSNGWDWLKDSSLIDWYKFPPLEIVLHRNKPITMDGISKFITYNNNNITT